MSRVWLGLSFIQVTSAGDDLSHLVAFRLYEEGLMAGEGRYAALCGRTILAASMSTTPGRDCPLCRASLGG